MQQITEIGVGNIFGSGDLDITIPGGTGTATIPCSWGFSTGYYLIIITLLLHLILFFHTIIPKIINRKKSKTTKRKKLSFLTSNK